MEYYSHVTCAPFSIPNKSPSKLISKGVQHDGISVAASTPIRERSLLSENLNVSSIMEKGRCGTLSKCLYYSRIKNDRPL